MSLKVLVLENMNLWIRKKKIVSSLFLLGLLFFAFGHTFILPKIADASTATPAHHDITTHESEESHATCPTDLHQLSYNRDQDGGSNAIDVSTLPNVRDYIPLAIIWFCLITESEHPYVGVPFDRKTVLQI